MGRTNYALMSLTAAIPGALLVLLIVTGFLKHADKMPGMLSVVAGITLLVAALLAATPVGILLFGGPKSARAAAAPQAAAVASKPAKSAKAPLETDESFVADEDLGGEVDESADDWNEGDSSVNFSDSEIMDAEGDEFEFDDAESGEIDADFDFDDDEKR